VSPTSDFPEIFPYDVTTPQKKRCHANFLKVHAYP